MIGSNDIARLAIPIQLPLLRNFLQETRKSLISFWEFFRGLSFPPPLPSRVDFCDFRIVGALFEIEISRTDEPKLKYHVHYPRASQTHKQASICQQTTSKTTTYYDINTVFILNIVQNAVSFIHSPPSQFVDNEGQKADGREKNECDMER